ncbi:MAG TPA: hypothetical protein VF535_08135 [Allosphingosinicella sp.]|jgi:imidazolonepropionase-like amidohydrolase
MTGVKFYGTFNPAWLPAAAAEAHKLGLHVHGHVPAGMRTLDAIEAGYDEVTHIYFMMMQAMPDEVVAHSNGIQRFQGPDRYAKDVDLNGEPIRKLIARWRGARYYALPTAFSTLRAASTIRSQTSVSPAAAITLSGSRIVRSTDRASGTYSCQVSSTLGPAEGSSPSALMLW